MDIAKQHVCVSLAQDMVSTVDIISPPYVDVVQDHEKVARDNSYIETKSDDPPGEMQGVVEKIAPTALVPVVDTTHLKIDEDFYNVLHWNMNGVRARLRDGSFWKALQGHDVLCITEFRCPRKEFLRKKDVRQRLKSLGFLYWATHASTANKGYAGVCVISKAYVESSVGDPELDKEGRLVMAHFESFTLVVGYLPNSGKKGELVRLAK